jgi:hypothetical protein
MKREVVGVEHEWVGGKDDKGIKSSCGIYVDSLMSQNPVRSFSNVSSATVYLFPLGWELNNWKNQILKKNQLN